MTIRPVHTSLFRSRDSLERFLFRFLPRLREKDIVVITSKIIALSQGRIVAVHSLKEKESLVKRESKKVITTPWFLLGFKYGEWRPNAGIDESNAYKKLILLPKEPWRTARDLQKALKKKYKLKRLGVLITDTRTKPLEKGTIGSALAFFGFVPFKSYVGRKDLFGKSFKWTRVNLAQGLAAAAGLVMGEGKECNPLAIIRGAPVRFTEHFGRFSLSVSPSKDIYRFVYLS